MKKIRILLAEDFAILREDLRDLIDRQDDMIVVGEAASGAKIIELANSVPYDLILMDIEMESMNSGILAAEQIRDKNEDSQIIFLTAHETREMILTAMGAGAIDYIVKGCEEEEILEHIRRAMSGNPMMQAMVHDTVMQEYMRLQKSERSLLFFINRISNLTATERELVRFLLQGKKIAEIASDRHVEISTTKTQIKGLLRKFGCSRSREIVDMIRELNIGHLF